MDFTFLFCPKTVCLQKANNPTSYWLHGSVPLLFHKQWYLHTCHQTSFFSFSSPHSCVDTLFNPSSHLVKSISLKTARVPFFLRLPRKSGLISCVLYRVISPILSKSYRMFIIPISHSIYKLILNVLNKISHSLYHTFIIFCMRIFVVFYPLSSNLVENVMKAR